MSRHEWIRLIVRLRHTRDRSRGDSAFERGMQAGYALSLRIVWTEYRLHY